MSTLLEATFQTVNLKSIYNRTIGSTTKSTGDSQATNIALPDNMAECGAILKARLDTNSKLEKDSQQSISDIESSFFKEFFNKFWEPDCAKQLILLGDNLRKILKVIGFDKNTNPILAFVSQDSVKERLLKTKLLNVDTFKLICSAFINKTIAHGQFMKEYSFNIIYCADLYRKSLTEIRDYIKLQSEILTASSGGNYSSASIRKNRMVFFDVPNINEPDINKRVAALEKITVAELPRAESAKLNSLAMAQAISKKLGYVSHETKTVPINSDDITALANKLDTPAKKLAAIMSLSITTDSEEVKSAALSNKLSNVTTDELRKATIEISPILPKGKLSKNSASALVGLLLSKT